MYDQRARAHSFNFPRIKLCLLSFGKNSVFPNYSSNEFHCFLLPKLSGTAEPECQVQHGGYLYLTLPFSVGCCILGSGPSWAGMAVGCIWFLSPLCWVFMGLHSGAQTSFLVAYDDHSCYFYTYMTSFRICHEPVLHYPNITTVFRWVLYKPAENCRQHLICFTAGFTTWKSLWTIRKYVTHHAPARVSQLRHK